MFKRNRFKRPLALLLSLAFLLTMGLAPAAADEAPVAPPTDVVATATAASTATDAKTAEGDDVDAASSSTVMIYTGGDIVTVNDEMPEAEALAVQDGKIIAVGTKADVEKAAGADAITVDLAGHTLIPGFYDAHSHFFKTGRERYTQVALNPPPVGDVKSIDDLIAALKEKADKSKEGQWILGARYDDGEMVDKRHPTADDLDKVSTELPIVITHFSGHNVVANHKALELAGITKDTPDPEGGQIGKDAEGNLNGQLWETAMDLVNKNIPPLTEQDNLDSLALGSKIYAEYGYTTVNEGNGISFFEMYIDAIDKGLIKQHVSYWFTGKELDQAVAAYKKYTNGTESVHYLGKDNKLAISGVKMFQDGSPQLRTAYMTDPYYTFGEYEEGWKGYPRQPREKLIKDVVAAHQAGINQIYIHGNGDAAIDDVLAAYETVYNGVKDGSLRQPESIDAMRHVVIHSQFSREEQYAKMKEIHALPSFLIMHPYFLGDRHWDIYFGPERSARMSPTRDAINNGLRFALHSDAPVFPVSPLLMMQTAVERKSFTGRDIFTTKYDKDSKYRSVDQRITPAEALKALTLDAAYHHGEEKVAGSLEVGKRADFAILDANPLKVDTSKIKDIKVLETIVDGETIYKADAAEKPDAEAPLFKDIKNHWAEADIAKAVDAKLLVGMSEDTFGPEVTVKRAMVVAVLHRMAGEPEAKTADNFKDVAEGDWFADPVNWAAEAGVVNGMSEDTFAPNEPVTREQLAAMLANFSEKNGKKVEGDADVLKAFKDQPSDWAARQVQWAVAQKLIGGMSADTLAPTGDATRAQFAAILNRYTSLS